MSRHFDGFIEQQLSRGIPVTRELLEVNQELKQKDEAKERWQNRDFWCKIGLHSGIPLTCVKCWRHLL